MKMKVKIVSECNGIEFVNRHKNITKIMSYPIDNGYFKVDLFTDYNSNMVTYSYMTVIEFKVKRMKEK